MSKLEGRLNELPFVFAQAVFVSASGTGEFANAFQRTLFPVGTAHVKDLADAEAFPDANLVQLPRGRGGYHLVVAGRSAEDILTVIEKLGEVDTVAGPGLIVSVE